MWPHVPRRSTRDVDLLGIGEGGGESSPARLEEVFRFLCGIAAPEDGLSFEKESVRVTPHPPGAALRRTARAALGAFRRRAHSHSSGRGFWRCCDAGTSRRPLSDIAAFACTTLEGLLLNNIQWVTWALRASWGRLVPTKWLHLQRMAGWREPESLGGETERLRRVCAG